MPVRRLAAAHLGPRRVRAESRLFSVGLVGIGLAVVPAEVSLLLEGLIAVCSVFLWSPEQT
jgi:hypothetical protein